jgi:hypothetical protein
LKSVVLDLDKLKYSHTGGNLAERIFEILDDYEISDKVKTLTTDGGSNMIKIYNELNNKTLEITQILCSAHQINLAVKSGLEYRQIISKFRKIIDKIRRSPKLLE